ncbi:MAG TPA: hypothetical protein VG077_05745 [Verrucomicrobiae bacterium]|nr:hypothetical protein [Verrucomicrobiae bacterium]
MKPVQAFLQKASGILINRISDGPWRSKSVLAALAVVVAGLGIWVSEIKNGPTQSEAGSTVAPAPAVTPPATGHWNWSKPFPFYVPMGVSYAAGFCIGWVFRRLIRIILAFTALVITLLALGKFAGCDVTPAQERVKHTSNWVQQEATTAKDYLQHLLPSVGAGGVGTFLGFRRRGKAAAARPADSPTANPPGPD